MTLHALTLWQPWAWAIAHGPKRIENRTWRPPACFLGLPLAIHAGLRYDDEAAAWLQLHQAELGLAAPPPPEASIDKGAIVAVGRLAGVLVASSSPWFAGPFGWLLEDVVTIEPVPCRGAQKIWRVPAAEAAGVLSRCSRRK